MTDNIGHPEIESASVGRRADPRAAIGMVVAVASGAGRLIPALLANLSRGGFRLDRVAGDLKGGAISLHVPGAEPLDARIRWSKGSTLGCQFIEPLPD